MILKKVKILEVFMEFLKKMNDIDAVLWEKEGYVIEPNVFSGLKLKIIGRNLSMDSLKERIDEFLKRIGLEACDVIAFEGKLFICLEGTPGYIELEIVGREDDVKIHKIIYTRGHHINMKEEGEINMREFVERVIAKILVSYEKFHVYYSTFDLMEAYKQYNEVLEGFIKLRRAINNILLGVEKIETARKKSLSIVFTRDRRLSSTLDFVEMWVKRDLLEEVIEILVSVVESILKPKYDLAFVHNFLRKVREKYVPALNFRDITKVPNAYGMNLREGLIFRSARMNRYPSTFLEKLLREKKIKVIVDLRTRAEIEKEHNYDTHALNIHYENIPVGERIGEYHKDPRINGYLSIIYEYPTELKRIFEIFAECEQKHVLVHCAAGKDRTGVVISLLQRVIGVPKELVIADYLHSFTDANSEALETVLNSIKRRFESVNDFLTDYCKVKEETIQRIFSAFNQRTNRKNLR